jgi:tetratricopeptide (TPR) repeat protein
LALHAARIGAVLSAIRPVAVLAGLLAAGCASPLEMADELYRDGALREAVGVWRSVPTESAERARAEERLEVVEGELGRMLRRFEKQAAFFEAEGRLAEAILYYRLALEIDPGRDATLTHVQKLARELKARAAALRESMLASLERKDLVAASQRADELLAVNPLDPAVQIDVSQVQHAIGAEILRNMESGRRAYAAGDLGAARASFEAVRALDDDHEEALGYLSYIDLSERRAERRAERRPAAPAPLIEPRSEPSSADLLAEGHFRKGQAAERRDDDFRALEEYEQALAVNARHLGARRGLERLRRQLADQVPTLYADGKRYFQDDDLHNALRSWHQVLLIQPDHEQATDNAERARRILERLEEIQSGS